MYKKFLMLCLLVVGGHAYAGHDERPYVGWTADRKLVFITPERAQKSPLLRMQAFYSSLAASPYIDDIRGLLGGACLPPSYYGLADDVNGGRIISEVILDYFPPREQQRFKALFFARAYVRRLR